MLMSPDGDRTISGKTTKKKKKKKLYYEIQIKYFVSRNTRAHTYTYTTYHRHTIDFWKERRKKGKKERK